MKYDYVDLNSQLNLHRAEIERVLVEARQALEAVELNQQLIKQHQQLTLRLHEIKVRQALNSSRISELKSSLRLARIELEGLEMSSKTESKRANLHSPWQLVSPSYLGHGAADGGSETMADLAEYSTQLYSREIEHVSRLALHGPLEAEWKNQRQRELSKQMAVFQLELVELVNQKAKLENHRALFQTELLTTEQQLQAGGIAANRTY